MANRRKTYQDPTESDGGACPVCGCRHFFEARVEGIGATVYRSRRCRHCGREIVTTERA